MAPPINRNVEDTPPGGPNGFVPPPAAQSQIPAFRYLRPTMFGAANWNGVVARFMEGFTPAQQAAAWGYLVKFDNPQGAKNISRSLNTAQAFMTQLVQGAKTQTPEAPTEPDQPPPAVNDPNAYDPNEIDAINNPSKPEPRTEEIVQPKTGDLRMNNGAQEVFVNGVWRPLVTNAGPQTPYAGSGDTATPNINADPSLPPVTTVTPPPMVRDTGAVGVPSTARLFTNPNARPTIAPKAGNEWYWDVGKGRWLERISYQTTAQNAFTPPPKVTTGHNYGGYNYMFDPLRGRYIRAGKVGARGVQFANKATAPQFISTAEWNRLMGGGTKKGTANAF